MAGSGINMQTLGFLLSILVHAGILAVAFFVATSQPLPVDLDKPVYTVDLVSLAPPAPSPAIKAMEKPSEANSEPAQTKKAEAIKAEPIPDPISEVKPIPKPIPKTEVKKISEKKEKPKKVIVKKKPNLKEKPEPPKKKVPQKTSKELLAEAMKDVKKDVRRQKRKERQSLRNEIASIRKAEGDQVYATGGEGGVAGGTPGGTGSGLSQIYASIVGEAIKKNWRYPALAGDQNLVATAEMSLADDGTILSSRITVSSGNAKFDSSILRAIHETERVVAPQTQRDKRILINFNSQEVPE